MLTTRTRNTWSLMASLAGAGLILGSIAWPALARQDEEAKELVRRYFTECFAVEAQGCLEDFWTAEAAERIRHEADRRRSLFSDIAYSLEELIAEGERVVAIFRVSGTASGPPTEESGALDHLEVAIYTVREGTIVDGTVIANLLDVARALGYRLEAPPPGPP